MCGGLSPNNVAKDNDEAALLPFSLEDEKKFSADSEAQGRDHEVILLILAVGVVVQSSSILRLVFVLWLLWTQRSWLGQKTVITEDTGHGNWDGIRELNHPLPRWWIIMYLGLTVIGVGIMVLYPALGSWTGLRGWHAAHEVSRVKWNYVKPLLRCMSVSRV